MTGTGGVPAGRRARRRWAQAGILALAALLLYLAFRGVGWAELGARLADADLGTMALAWGLMTLAMALRSVRWGVLVRERAQPGFLTMFWATTAGYVGNSYLPARAGDVLRSVLLARHLEIRKTFTLGTTVTERILDTIVVVALAGGVVALIPVTPGWLASSSIGLSIAAFVALIALLAAPRLARWIELVATRLPIKQSWRDGLVAMWHEFFTGAKAIQRPGGALAFGSLTAVVWAIDAACMFTVATALGLDAMTPLLALLMVVALALSSVAPSTPGYVGVYQFVAVSVLTPIGFVKTEALALVLLFQAAIYAAVTPWGLIGLWRLGGIGRARDDDTVPAREAKSPS